MQLAWGSVDSESISCISVSSVYMSSLLLAIVDLVGMGGLDEIVQLVKCQSAVQQSLV